MITPLTVEKLSKYLETLPQKAQIMISSDPEGNRFSPMDANYSLGGLVWAAKDLTDIIEPGDPTGTEALVLYPIA
jgi:hypothetical protein